MDVAVILQSLGDLEHHADDRAIFDVLKATLQYPANAQAKGVKLADDIIFLSESKEGGGPGLWWVWMVVLDIARCIPPGHSWQDSLLQCLDNLCQRGGRPKAYNKWPNDEQWVLWRNLPEFSSCVREMWIIDPTGREEALSAYAKWKNFNSFMARYMSKQAVIWLNLPVWQLRDALEEPPRWEDFRPGTECELWVASEWIIQCAGPIFKEMKSEADPESEHEARVYSTGSLCGSKPFSVERW